MRTTIAVAAAATFAGFATAFDASSNTNVVTYWGQGSGQGSLLSYCENPNIDIINIGFVNVFPDQGKGGWPGTNFGNACGSETYSHNGTATQLLSNCPDIGPDIVLCQEIYGTKIFLSIGGASADGYNVDDNSARNFAAFLWGSFGPSLPAWTNANGPRPFGDAVVDGFDFDIESDLSSAPTVNGSTISDYKTRGWAAMVNYFKDSLFPQDTSKSYYLSAAPQCVVPDEHLSTVIASAWFDFIFVQFYNTAQCSARSALSSAKRATGFTGYDNWASAPSFNTAAKIYMGLAASTDSASDGSYYIAPPGVKTLVNEVESDSRFGGIMLWQASTAEDNVICDKDYATWMKQILVAKADGTDINTQINPCPAQPITTDGTCGGYNGYTCVGSMFGSCCSIYGYCGDTSEYCAVATCDTKGGDCGDEYVGIIGSTNFTSNTTSTNTTSSSSGYTMTATSTALLNSTTASSGLPAVTSSAGGKYSNSTSNDSRFCPSLNGQVYDSYTIQCNTNHYGVVINATIGSNTTLYSKRQATSVPTSLGDCLTLCDATTSCVGTGFNSAAQTCTLFSTVGAAYNDGNVDFGTVVPSDETTTSASASADPATSTLLTTSTVFATVTQTITTTNAAGEPTVYVTALVTSYTTVCPATAAEATTTATYNAASANANFVPSTKTLYSTYHVTIMSCAPTVTDCPLRPESQTAVTLTSTYAVGTTVVTQAAFATSSDNSVTTSTQTVRQTSVVYKTVTVSSSTQSPASSVASAAPFAINVAPYALSNSSSTYYPTGTAGTVSSTIVQIVTATVAPVQLAQVSHVSHVSAGFSVAPISGAASSTAGYNSTATASNMLPVFTGAAARAELGMGAIALAVGALLAL